MLLCRSFGWNLKLQMVPPVLLTRALNHILTMLAGKITFLPVEVLTKGLVLNGIIVREPSLCELAVVDFQVEELLFTQ